MADQPMVEVIRDPLYCPSCGHATLRRGRQNLWCATCGFFPIPYGRQHAPHLEGSGSEPPVDA